jgi:hypothetical protein
VKVIGLVTGGLPAALEQALERYERKKNLAIVAQVRPRLKPPHSAMRGRNIPLVADILGEVCSWQA